MTPTEFRARLLPDLEAELDRLPESEWPRFLAEFTRRAQAILDEGRPKFEVLDGGRENR